MENLDAEVQAVFKTLLKNCSPREVKDWEIISVQEVKGLPDRGNELLFLVNARPIFVDEDTDLRDIDPIFASRNMDKLVSSYFWDKGDHMAGVEKEIYLNDSIMIPVTFLK